MIYIFLFSDNIRIEFTSSLSLPDFSFINKNPKLGLNFTELEFNRCPNCPLDINKHRYCPVAINLYTLSKEFETVKENSNCELIVITDERTYSNSSDFIKGFSSLVTLIIMTSGCPVLDFLRPVLLSYTPFPTGEEVAFKIISSYLLGQHMKKLHGKKPDWEMTELIKTYQHFMIINKYLLDRLKNNIPNMKIFHESGKLLQTHGIFTVGCIEEHILPNIKGIYEPYLK